MMTRSCTSDNDVFAMSKNLHVYCRFSYTDYYTLERFLHPSKEAESIYPKIGGLLP